MQSLIYADVFFFISAVGFIALFVVLLAALIYILLVVRDIKQITKAMREEGEAFIHDIGSLRGAFSSGAAKAVSAIIGAFIPRQETARGKRKKKSSSVNK